MDRRWPVAKPVAYGIVIAGCILAVVTAMAAMPSGAYWLSGTFLVLGITPYIVYASCTEVLRCCPLIGAGIAVLLADFVARIGPQIIHTPHASALPALYLALVLTLIVLPAGAAVGKLAEKLWP